MDTPPNDAFNWPVRASWPPLTLRILTRTPTVSPGSASPFTLFGSTPWLLPESTRVASTSSTGGGAARAGEANVPRRLDEAMASQTRGRWRALDFVCRVRGSRSGLGMAVPSVEQDDTGGLQKGGRHLS